MTANPRQRIWTYILNSTSAPGCWNLDDFDEWAPITTAFVVDLVLRSGVDPDEEWISGKPGSPERFSIQKCLEYLDAQIRHDGSFGEDLWDATKFAETIIVFKLKDRVPGADRLISFLHKALDEGQHLRKDATWDGPGVIASLTQFLIASGARGEAENLISELTSQQASSGEFRGSVGTDGNDLASPVWHTSQVLAAFLQFGISERDDRVARMIEWLCQTQAPAGNWPGFSRYEIYYTSYAVVALSKLASPPRAALDKAVDWLKSNVSVGGKVRDVGGTVMTCVALSYAEGFIISGSFSGVAFHNLTRIQDKLNNAEFELGRKSSECAEAQKELTRFREKFGNADFGITIAQAFLWGLVSLVIGVALSLIPPLVGMISRPSPAPSESPAKQVQVPGSPR
jgi:hypothetical protein